MNSSIDISKIPIKNIYYMLVYSWKHPREKTMVSTSQKDYKDLTNLLSDVLAEKLRSLVKKGIYKEYKQKHELSSIIKGKIDFTKSVSSFSLNKAQLYIDYEDLTVDTLHNQIIKRTLTQLLRHNNLNTEIQSQLKKLLYYFSSVSLISLKDKHFKMVKYHKNNAHYQFIIKICHFLCNNSLLHEDEGSGMFYDYSRQHKALARLFESFIKNFYSTELSNAIVKRQNLYWSVTGSIENFIPQMKTDISIELPEEKIIIDTKFYHSALQINFNKSTVNSNHIYQVFSYLVNDSHSNNKKQTGILLYPEVNEPISLTGTLNQYKFKVYTVNLYADWQTIHNRLLDIVR